MATRPSRSRALDIELTPIERAPDDHVDQSTNQTPARYRRRSLVMLHSSTDELAPARPQIPETTLDDLPAVIMDRVNQYLDTPAPGYVLVVAAPAGGGKTTIAVQIAERVAASGYRVFYAGPRHDFFADVMQLAGRPAWWYEWHPRYNQNSEQLALCRYGPQIEEWQRRGYRGIDFCSAPMICGWSYINDVCPYHQQRKISQSIVFGQHAHIALGHPLMEQMQLVIGDELPLSAFLHQWTIPVEQIVPPDMDPFDELTILLRNLQYLARQTPDDGERWEGATLYQRLIPGGTQRVADILADNALDLDIDAFAPALRNANDAMKVPYFHLPDLLHLMKRETRQILRQTGAGLDDRPVVIPRVRVDERGLTLLLRRHSKGLPQHVIWLDATGDERIYRELFDRPVEVVRPNVPLRGRVYQLYTSMNNKAALVDERVDVEGQQRGDRKLSQLREQISHIVEQRKYATPAVISYKDVVERLAFDQQNTVYFGASRGTNRLQSCDALFVVGAPMPPLSAIKDTAAMLFQRRQTPWSDSWHARDVAFTEQNPNGHALGYPVNNFWDDDDLLALMSQLREAEIIQAIHRARPLRRDVDIWLLTNIVVSMPVILVGSHQLYNAVDAAGAPIAGIDPKTWPKLMTLANAATRFAPLTSAMIVEQLDVSRPTAKRWLEALVRSGQFELARPDPTQRGRPALAVIPVDSTA